MAAGGRESYSKMAPQDNATREFALNKSERPYEPRRATIDRREMALRRGGFIIKRLPAAGDSPAGSELLAISAAAWAKPCRLRRVAL